MKTKLKWLASLVATLLTVLAPASWAQGTLRFDVYAGVVQRPVSQATINGIVEAARAGTPQTGNWTPVANGSTIPLALLFNFGTTGSGLRYVPAISRTNAFTLAQVGYTTSDPVFGSSSGNFSTYGNLGYGKYWGADGVSGPDDTIVTGNNPNALVNEFYFYGFGLTIDGGNTPINDLINSWKDLTYHDFGITLGTESVGGRINFSANVPEPSCGAILLFGLIGLHLKKRK